MELVRNSRHFLHWKGEEAPGSTESSSELTGREEESGPPTLGHLEGRLLGQVDGRSGLQLWPLDTMCGQYTLSPQLWFSFRGRIIWELLCN